MATLSYSMFAPQTDEEDYYVSKQNTNKKTAWKLNRSLIGIGILMCLGLVVAIVTYTIKYEGSREPLNKSRNLGLPIIGKTMNNNTATTSTINVSQGNPNSSPFSHSISHNPGSHVNDVTTANGFLLSSTTSLPPITNSAPVQLKNERIYIDEKNQLQIFHIPGQLTDTYVLQNYKLSYVMTVTLLKRIKGNPSKVFYCKTTDMESVLPPRNITLIAERMTKLGFEVIQPPQRMPIFNYRSCDYIPVSLLLKSGPFVPIRSGNEEGST